MPSPSFDPTLLSGFSSRDGGVANIADAAGSGQSSFPVRGEADTYLLVAEDDFGNRATVEFQITDPESASRASVSVLNSPVPSGDALAFAISGFPAGAQVRIYVLGGGGVTMAADDTGAGRFGFVNNDPPGVYTLVAEDDFGNQAQIGFAVSTPLEPALLEALNSPVESGQALAYSFAGFQPDSAVRVFVQGGGGLTNSADSSGSGSFAFINNDPIGAYILIAEDDFGHRATADFEVTSP